MKSLENDISQSVNIYLEVIIQQAMVSETGNFEFICDIYTPSLPVFITSIDYAG